MRWFTLEVGGLILDDTLGTLSEACRMAQQEAIILGCDVSVVLQRDDASVEVAIVSHRSVRYLTQERA